MEQRYDKTNETTEEFYQNGNTKSNISKGLVENYYENGNLKSVIRYYIAQPLETWNYRFDGTLSLTTRTLCNDQYQHDYKIFHDLKGVPYKVNYKYDSEYRTKEYSLKRGGYKPDRCPDNEYQVMKELLEVGAILELSYPPE